MSIYALNLGTILDGDDGRRILSATFDEFAPQGQPRVETLPQGDITNFLYTVGGEYVSSPLPEPEPPAPSMSESLQAQTYYTALMTDTVMEEAGLQKVDTLKQMYRRGTITTKELDALMNANKITQAEYEEIVAEDE